MPDPATGPALVDRPFSERAATVSATLSASGPPDIAGQPPAARYLPAIDGLRFFAVGSVLLFHLWHPLLPGGFIGVDVFFVISGFLITGMLARHDHAAPLIAFYQNRIARIAPASLAVIIATLAAGYWLYDAQTYAYLGTASLFAALSLINLKLLFQSSYFAASPDAQPLLHFWSLAVEEQFYLFYPALLLAVRRLRWPLAKVLAGAGIASLALSLVLTVTHPTWAFYLLPTRAWELCAGGWLAVRQRAAGEGGEELRGWAGLALLIGGFALISDARPFPGWLALIPVGATMLILEAAQAEGSLSRLLAQPPLMWVGLRSYSLYLWHWPVFSMADYALYQQTWSMRLLVKIGLTSALALLSYEAIEQPLRRYLRQRGRRRVTFALFFAVVAAICLAGYQIRNNFYLSAEGQRLEQGGYLFNPGARPRIAMIGDSEAAMYGTVMRDLARAHGWRLRLLGAANTNALPGEPGSRWAAIEPWLRRDRPDCVIIAYAWMGKLGDGAALDRALTAVSALGARVVLVLEPPHPRSGPDYSPRSDARLIVAEADPAARRGAAAKVRAIAARHGALVIDPASLFLTADGALRVAAPGGRAELYDAGHLSQEGAVKVGPLLVEAISAGPVR